MDAFIISSLPSLRRRLCKWQGPFAPRTLLRFIAVGSEEARSIALALASVRRSVGSRTGAPALAEMPLDQATSPAPATSNATCGFAESAWGVSPRAAHRSGHEPLDSSGSCHPPKTAAFR